MAYPRPPWETHSTASHDQRNGSTSPLPPGAMLPSAPGSKPPQLDGASVLLYDRSYDDRIPGGGQMRGSVSMNEFGAGAGPSSRQNQTMPLSSSHRALPVPGAGGRRPLPVPPRPPPPSVPSVYAETGRLDPTISPRVPPRNLPSRPNPTTSHPSPLSPQDRPPTPPPKAPNTSRLTSDRVAALRPHTPVYDSPGGHSGSQNGYMDGSGPSRTTSMTNSMSGMSTSDHSRDAYSSNTSYSQWDPSVTKLDELDGTGTNITIRPPSTGPPGSYDYHDGRKTPTPSDWADTPLPPPPGLDPEGRKRTVSSSTIGAVDAGLPATPKVVPQAILQDNRMPHIDDSFGFPVPHLSPAARINDPISRPSSSGYSDQSPIFASGSRSHPPQRHISQSSSHGPSISTQSAVLSPSWAEQSQEPSSWVQRKLQIHQSHGDEDYDDVSGAGISVYDNDEDDYDVEQEEEAEVHESRFFQPAFLSEAALQLRDRVERRRQTKAGINWQGSFTGRDIVTTIQSFLPSYTRDSTNDRRFALLLAQSLQNQLWFVEVDWDIKPLRDSPEDVFRFMGEMEGIGAGDGLNSELPSGLMTMATRCYSPSCPQDSRCYASRCPFKQTPSSFLYIREPPPTPESSSPVREDRREWTERVDGRVLRELSDAEYHRQTIIRQAIQQEIQYSADLSALEELYISGLRDAQPPIIPRHRLEKFIHEVFHNEAEIHEASGRILDHFTIRERESAQPGLIPSVGDIFLQAAADFRNIYPEYTGNLPQAENVLRQEMEDNADFRFFCDRIVRENDGRSHIKYLITRPSDQLQRTYPAVLESILAITDPTEPDHDFLIEALSSIQNLSAISQLKLFHASQGRGQAGKKQWHDLVPEEARKDSAPKEQKRQMQIWELIQGEMEYVADLETMDTLFVDKLRMAENGPVIERSRVEIFLDEAFHNYRSLLDVHQYLLENLQARQLEQHPQVGAIGDLLLDAALNWQDAYMEYVTHYPIAKAKVQEEEMKNPKFAAFLKECLKDPLSHRQDIYHFINRPIPRLLRYNLLLADILKSLKESGCPDDHPDIETIPQVIDLIKDLGRATQKGVAVNESKIELWTYQHSLDGTRFGARVVKDLDLLNPMRELIHRGKVFRQPEGPMSSWAELTVLLFDNYFVLVKSEKHRSSRREERQERYIINRRPIPLELLSIGQFGDAPRPRRDRPRIMGGGSSHEPENNASEANTESNKVWPFSISFIGQGQLGGQYTLWSESYASRAEWQDKLQHAIGLRNEVNDANKVFELTPLSQDTFYMSYSYAAPKAEGDAQYTGRVTCSAPFTTVDGRALVAIGCEEGVWIGLRHDPHSLRKVLHVKAVSNIAVLEEFGIFLVLQDRSLLAYHLEALVPSASSPQVRAAPQRLSPGKDISFFTVGRLSGRTLVLYMKKKGMDSLFRVLEPISGRNAEEAARQRRPFGNLLGQRTEWFRLYKDFFIPTEALGVHWLKAKLAVVCAKGFEIMDLTDLKGGSIPIFEPAKVRDKPHLADLQRRCDTSKPLGMFRSTETEFLLCYDSFGIYVDRHGEPNRDAQAIDWEGRPDSVAFHPPYVLLVSTPFIEIRHIDTGKLLQIYTGTDIHLTWDGTGGMMHPPQDNPGPKGYGDETSSQEPRIHISQRPDDPRHRARGISQGIPQHVFELTPTLLLNNPLLNPVHTHDSNYFPPAPMMRGDMRSDMGDRRRSSSFMTSNSGEFYASQQTTPNLHMTSMNGTQNDVGIHRSSSGTSSQSQNVIWSDQGLGPGQLPYTPNQDQRPTPPIDPRSQGYPSQRQGSYAQYEQQYANNSQQSRPAAGRPSYDSYTSQESNQYQYSSQQPAPMQFPTPNAPAPAQEYFPERAHSHQPYYPNQPAGNQGQQYQYNQHQR